MSAPRQLIQQAVYIPECDFYLKSTHQHDYVTHKWTDTEGKKRSYAVDGGLVYCRRAGDLDLGGTRIVDWCLYDDDPFVTIAARLLWGTRGLKGDTPLRHRPIASFDLDHLKAILKTQVQVRGTLVERVVKWWIAAKEAPLS